MAVRLRLTVHSVLRSKDVARSSVDVGGPAGE
jgi:hypothetical protein